MTGFSEMLKRAKMNNFSYFSGNILQSRALGVVNLEDLHVAHAKPKSATVLLIDRIRVTTDIEEKKLLKRQLHAFTPSVIIKGKRSYNGISEFSGYAQLDFDKLKSDYAEDLKRFLFDTYEPIKMSYISPSGRGVKCIIEIPKIEVGLSISDSIEEYKDYYRAIASEFSQYEGFDAAPKNCVLPLFLSYDLKTRYRANGVVWDLKEDAPPPPPIKTHNLNISVTEYSDKSQEYFRIKTRGIFERRISAIVDNGHPQVVEASLILGSRVGFGYMTNTDAASLMEYMISGNHYLAKDVKGYIKTAFWAFNKGANNPKPY